jgi:glucose/arabinose dehydrogenase
MKFPARALRHALPARIRPAWATPLLLGVLAGCGDPSRLPTAADVGPKPTLVEPRTTLIPTVNIAPAVGWAAGTAPTVAAGLQVQPFAEGLAHPRWLLVLPNGDVLVAETNAPPRPEANQGLRAWAMKQVMKTAGAGVPSANRITLLRDADGDGRAEVQQPFLQALNSPFGMALVGDTLYVANTDAVMAYPYRSGDTQITAAGRKLADLPAGPRNHHWTKNIIASADGTRLYATVGSNSNVAENGMAEEERRAAILEIDIASGNTRVFASGLRNPNGLAWEPSTGVLWTVVNERDEIGSDLVPDYLTSVRDGAFYGWPYSWYGQHVDTRVSPQRPELVQSAEPPDYALGSHVAALGLATTAGSRLPAPMGQGPGATGAAASAPAASATASAPITGMFIGMHGSWNRKPLNGYKVAFVPFNGGKPSGPPVDVLGGFVNNKGEAQGRPVGVAIDGRGALLVADDVGNKVWRVSGVR